MTSRLTAVIFTGGVAPDESAVDDLDPSWMVIAADSGFDHARALGFRCDLLVGDMDSISASGLKEATAAGIEIVRHPSAKDHTDLELALAEAQARGAGRIVVVAGDHGRLDHQLVNVAVLGADHLSGVEVEARMAGSRLFVVRDRRELDAPVGALVSILPLGGLVHGVRTRGLRWELEGETLQPAVGRGISNEVAVAPAEVRVGEGVLLVVQPGPPAT